MGAGVVGVWGYMVYLYWQFHNPVMFLFSQGSFKNQRANDLAGLVTPFQTVFRYIKILVTADPGNIAYWVAVLELAAFVFAVGVLGYLSINRRLPFWWFIFSWAVVILPAVTGTLTSMPRYVVVLTPIFVFLSQIENSKLKTLILGLFAVLQVVLTVLFLRGYWIA